MLQIAIDGPAGAGKSTVSTLLASKLGFNVLNTGDIYRAFTIAFLNLKILPTELDKIRDSLNNIHIEIKYLNGKQNTFLDGKNITSKLHENFVSENVSAYAKIQIIRDQTVHIQREISMKNNIVIEGRDIGTVVLPNANFKFFVTASDVVRADRRYKELISKGEQVEYEKILEEIRKRDYEDSTRKNSPLKMAEDGILIDTSNLTIDEAVNKMYNIVKEGK